MVKSNLRPLVKSVYQKIIFLFLNQKVEDIAGEPGLVDGSLDLLQGKGSKSKRMFFKHNLFIIYIRRYTL